MKSVCEIYKLWNLIKEPTCFKNPENHKIIAAMMKMYFREMKQQVIQNITTFIKKPF